MSNLIDPTLNWNDVEWLKTITKMPIIIKGILTSKSVQNIKKTIPKNKFIQTICLGEMAIEAVEHHVDGIIVSNHGARQLDGVAATVSKKY